MKYYCDGFVRGSNPSKWGGGYTIVDEDNNLIKQVEVEKVGFTNNEAEVLGILEAMKIAKEGDQVSTDSMCCLTWVNGGKSKARPDLKNILQECKQILKEKKINLMWEAREFNLAGIYNEETGKDRKEKYYMQEAERQASFLNSL